MAPKGSEIGGANCSWITQGFIEKAEEFGRKLAAKGWLGLAVPKKYGGTERSIVKQYVLFDEVKRADWPPQLMSQ